MKLSRIILQAVFIVAIIATFLAFCVSIFFQYTSFEHDKVYIEKEYVDLKKEEIKREVHKVHKYINYSQTLIDKKVRQKLQSRVNQAYKIAHSIYKENRDKKSIQELKYLIVTAIKNISYEDKRAYFFINGNDGRSVLFNKQSKLNSNNSVWDLKDKKGNYIVRRQSQVVQDRGEGFVINYFVKPDLQDNEQYPKISFVKMFEPFDWHIGMGEYIDDMEYEAKQEILSWIASIRFGSDGYIFVNNTKKQALVFDGKKLKTPKIYPNDVLYQQQLDAIKKEQGDYFFYKFKKLNTNKEYPKVAYVKEYNKWGWIIGSGVYIDEIENEIIRKENALLTTIFEQIKVMLLFILVIGVIIYFVSQQISKYINNNVYQLIKAFSVASKTNKEINPKKLTYKEFVTLAKSLNNSLKARNKIEQRLKDYIQIVNENVITSSTDKKGIITEVSEAFCKISGYSKEELIGKSHNIVRHEDMPKELYEGMWKNLKHEIPWEGDIKNKKKSGEVYWVDTVIKPKYENAKHIGYIAVRQDITDKKRVEYLSITDDLTQLYNRRYFNIKIEDELNRAKRENSFITFIMLDVDYFKKYNDTYGHHAGDSVLKEVSKVLKEHTKRASDFSFRLGGEEFGIIYTLRDVSESERFAQLIKEDVEALKIKHESSSVSDYLTVSMGVVTKNALDITNSDSFYKQTDEALYKAKGGGRNCVYVLR